jgi:hypothetical protein
MKRMCRQSIAAPGASVAMSRDLLPHLRIITDPAIVARLNAEAAKLTLAKARPCHRMPPLRARCLGTNLHLG